MRHSRSISDLRADVAENCRALLMLAEREGLSVLVTETVRDAAYQRMLAEKGYAAKGAVTPSFHAEHAGLAFDICKNEAGHEYDDPAFFIRVGEIGKMLGFSWGGDWGSFPDRPHFQWDAGATYTSAMIRAKRYPPPMPRYEEEEMTQQQFDAMMENYLKRLAQQTPEKSTDSEGNPCVDLYTDTCGDRLRRFLRSKKVQAVSSREKRFKKTGNPGDRRNCADGSGGS